jgi:hypothetical protein
LRKLIALFTVVVLATLGLVAALSPEAASAAPTPVVLIVLENHYANHSDGAKGIYGDPNSPFINSVVSSSCSTTTPAVCGIGYTRLYDYSSLHSLPNYLVLTGGYSGDPNNVGVNGYKCQTDATATPTGTPGPNDCWEEHQTENNIFQELKNNSTSYGSRSYQESMSATCTVSNDSSGLYVVRHNPALFYNNLGTGFSCDGAGGTTAIDIKQPASLPATLPKLTVETPNVCDNMHGLATGSPNSTYIDGSTCAAGDADGTKRTESDKWLQTWVPAWVAKGATVVITFDEGTSNKCGVADPVTDICGDKVLTVVASPSYSSGSTDNTAYGVSPTTNASGVYTPSTSPGFCNILAGIETHYAITPNLGCSASLTGPVLSVP